MVVNLCFDYEAPKEFPKALYVLCVMCRCLFTHIFFSDSLNKQLLFEQHNKSNQKLFGDQSPHFLFSINTDLVPQLSTSSRFAYTYIRCHLFFLLESSEKKNAAAFRHFFDYFSSKK
jgi:hypothetical protein